MQHSYKICKILMKITNSYKICKILMKFSSFQCINKELTKNRPKFVLMKIKKNKSFELIESQTIPYKDNINFKNMCKQNSSSFFRGITSCKI